jgi:hypothetical protein
MGKATNEKPPAGYKVRLGGYIGHGKRTVHITLPDGFYFQWDMHEGGTFDARRDAIRKLHEHAANNPAKIST